MYIRAVGKEIELNLYFMFLSLGIKLNIVIAIEPFLLDLCNLLFIFCIQQVFFLISRNMCSLVVRMLDYHNVDSGLDPKFSRIVITTKINSALELFKNQVPVQTIKIKQNKLV